MPKPRQVPVRTVPTRRHLWRKPPYFLEYSRICSGASRALSLPGIKRMNTGPSLSFNEQLEEWRRVLVHLAEQYRAGVAAADPKPGACEFCGLRALCRIREFENER